MIFHWSLSDCKSPQISRNILSILANLNNTVIWMVSTHPLISKSSSLCTNSLVTVPSMPITIGIYFTFIFHSFFFLVLKKGLGTHLSFCFLSVLPCGQPEWQSSLFSRFFFCWLSVSLVLSMIIIIMICLLCSKLELFEHCLWGKQHHDTIHFSRNLETICCTGWHS